MIKVIYELDNTGCLVMSPVSDQLNRNIEAYLTTWHVAWDGGVLIQDNILTAMDNLTPREKRELHKGYPITKLVDPWEWLHWVGWDAHEGVEL